MNRSELRAEIARKEISKSYLADALGISRQTFWQKMRGNSEFTESEIRTLISVLGLTANDVNRLFLS